MNKVFIYITEIMGWLQIVASPLLLGLAIGSIVYFPEPTLTRLVTGIVFSVLGLVVGIIWATKIRKTKGTIQFLSRVSANPDVDNVTDQS